MLEKLQFDECGIDSITAVCNHKNIKSPTKCNTKYKVSWATGPSLERGSLPQLVRHLSKESKDEDTRKKGKMIKK